MVLRFRRHKQFLRFVRNRLISIGGVRTDHRHFEAFRKIEATNLEPAYALLAPLYSANTGRPARSSVSMFRSCLLMMECGITNFDEWVQIMRDEPVHAIYSGFELDDIPGIGTF